jgi:hypothetical protein
MGDTAVKESRLNIRCDSHMRELLDKAATYSHGSVSEFSSPMPWHRWRKWCRRPSVSP